MSSSKRHRSAKKMYVEAESEAANISGNTGARLKLPTNKGQSTRAARTATQSADNRYPTMARICRFRSILRNRSEAINVDEKLHLIILLATCDISSVWHAR